MHQIINILTWYVTYFAYLVILLYFKRLQISDHTLDLLAIIILSRIIKTDVFVLCNFLCICCVVWNGFLLLSLVPKFVTCGRCGRPYYLYKSLRVRTQSYLIYILFVYLVRPYYAGPKWSYFGDFCAKRAM